MKLSYRDCGYDEVKEFKDGFYLIDGMMCRIQSNTLTTAKGSYNLFRKLNISTIIEGIQYRKHYKQVNGIKTLTYTISDSYQNYHVEIKPISQKEAMLRMI